MSFVHLIKDFGTEEGRKLARGWMRDFADLLGKAVGIGLGFEHYTGSVHPELVEEWGYGVIGMRQDAELVASLCLVGNFIEFVWR